MSSSIAKALPSLVKLSATCDEIFSWMIGIRMTNHSVSDSNRNTVMYDPPKKIIRNDK